MGSTRRVRLSRAALSAFVVFSVATCVGAAEPPSDLPLHRMDGASFSLSTLKGRVVVLDFWASWCVPCRASVPFFNELQKKYEAQAVSVVGLSLEEDGDAVQGFLDDTPTSFLILRDPSGRAGEAFGVEAMPTTFLLDREGRVVARFEGSDKKIHARIAAAVATLAAGGALPSGTDVRVAAGLEATSGIKAWQRGYLADPIMSLDGTAANQIFREHVHASKEGAAGNGGASGGGCGCN